MRISLPRPIPPTDLRGSVRLHAENRPGVYRLVERFYCFVKLTRKAAPRLLVVHEAEGDGALYFGPFRGAP